MYELVKIYYLENNDEKMKYWINKIYSTIELRKFNEPMEMAIKNMQGNENDKKYINKYIEGEEQLKIDNYIEAKKNFEEMIKYKKEGMKYLADLYLTYDKNLEKTMELLLEAKEEGVDVGAELGMLYLKLGDSESAKEYLTPSVEKGNLTAAIILGHIMVKEGKEKEGEKLYLKAVEGKEYQVIHNLISYYEKTQNIEEIKKWVKYVKTTPALKGYNKEEQIKINNIIEVYNIVLN